CGRWKGSVFRVTLSLALARSFIIKSGCLGGYEENPPWPVVDMRVNLAAEKRHSAFVEPMGTRVIASATNILNGLEFLVFRWQAFRPHGVNVFLQDRPRGLAVLGGPVLPGGVIELRSRPLQTPAIGMVKRLLHGFPVERVGFGSRKRLAGFPAVLLNRAGFLAEGAGA